MVEGWVDDFEAQFADDADARAVRAGMGPDGEVVDEEAGADVVREPVFAAGDDAPEGVTSIDGVLDDETLDELLRALRGYEAALMANDLDALDRFFAPGPATLRGDTAALLVGHDRISAFRGLRGGVPPRSLTEVHLRVVAGSNPLSVLVVSVSVPAKGGSGLQTQLWTRLDTGWAISAAHVHAAAPAVDGRIWRVAGAPLVPPAGSGPLDGMTVAVKDLFAVRGFAIGAGVPEYLATAPFENDDADAVAALRASGASVVGIAQTDEFAYSVAGRNVHSGTTPNPAVPGAIGGGSSSGPASAVALGQATIGLGTDTGGSIRVPASYQGLWGIRTTHGSVSARGLLPLAPTFDTVGWLTRTPEVLRAAAVATFGAGAGAAAGAGAGGSAALESGFVVCADLVAGCTPEVQEAFDHVTDELVFGLVDQVDLGDLDAVFAAFRTVQGAEAWRQHGAWISEHPGALGPDIAERFETGSRVTAAEEDAARALLAEARHRFDEVLAGRVLLLPSASSSAPALDASAEVIASVRAATLRMTSVAGAGGYPAVSAPLLRVPAPGGTAPVGLCFIGPRGTDLPLLDLATSVATHLTP
ncbi:AtzH-like domain-containing protein [Herbiconiux sp. A18JL235]|uniref:AtzH-like domain-containing protein n=1 Tax=Herbiconiux sp. A18JL235 TaxID=3152363 RepID=A0AB39BL27_9MICO